MDIRPKFKILALDLDDTLLRSDLTISSRTKNALKKVQESGITLVLASGRVPGAMEKFSLALGMNKKPGYLVSNNGALILESHTGKIIRETRLAARTAVVAYELADAEGFALQVYEDNTIYVSRSNEFADYDQKLTGLRQVIPDNFRALLEQGCIKLLVPGDPMLLKPLESILRTYLGGEVTLFTSKPYFLELQAPNTDKGSALACIAGILGANREEVLAIGDSMNDEAMILWAGYSAAMPNGEERIKELASTIVPKTNDEDGVVELIERHVLGDEPFPGKGYSLTI
ncbi:MAG: Cof-type HAD-IIB family hydrolase [Spirochaetaceae bacterium]|jgi:Cof subfamily protein (haloacid dehalogenase superfamily)|nr:Cof-type HAD-IIB family hydrolase [Spirochaetaceae bacterium]